MKVKIFCCYAREDKRLLKKLKSHLSAFQELIEVWDDGEIIGGDRWDDVIKKQLNEADIILLLISADFMNSKYIIEVELNKAIEREKSGEARVIPIILRPCDWEETIIGKLQALPKNGKPVTGGSGGTHDRAFTEVAKGIREVVNNFLDHREKPEERTDTSINPPAPVSVINSKSEPENPTERREKQQQVPEIDGPNYKETLIVVGPPVEPIPPPENKQGPLVKDPTNPPKKPVVNNDPEKNQKGTAYQSISMRLRYIMGCITIFLVGLFGFFFFKAIVIHHSIFFPIWEIILDAMLIIVAVAVVFILFSRFSFDFENFSKRNKTLIYVIAVVLDILLILSNVFFSGPSPTPIAYAYCSYIPHGQTSTPAPINNEGIGVTHPEVGEFIGISDGSFAFDTNTAITNTTIIPKKDLPDIIFKDKEIHAKCLAANQLANGDQTGMMQSLEAAVSMQTNDAEAQIYLEDQRVLASPNPHYVTVVVATMLTGSGPDNQDQGNVGVGRDTLQGVYTAQYEHNHNIPNVADAFPKGIMVRILIANAGSKSAYVTQVAQQIIQLAHSDPTFIGVIGWNFSAYAEEEIKDLDTAQIHIPMISPTASKDDLKSPYFFRITPTNMKEALIGANYIHTIRNSKCILLLHGDDIFSQNLAKDFNGIYTDHTTHAAYGYVYEYPFHDNGGPHIFDTLGSLLLQAKKYCGYDPDLIYFAGYPADLGTLVTQLDLAGSYASLKIAGGDSLYEVGFPYDLKVYEHLLFTSAASPDAWGFVRLPEPPFYKEYTHNFDPSGSHPGIYGWSRADADSILSYDALRVLLDGYANVLRGQGSSYKPTPQVLRQELQQELQQETTFQGASGLVSLQDDNGNGPKVIVMLNVDSNGYTHPQLVCGRLNLQSSGNCQFGQ